MIKNIIKSRKIHRKKALSTVKVLVAYICSHGTRYLATGCLFLRDLLSQNYFFKKGVVKRLLTLGFMKRQET